MNDDSTTLQDADIAPPDDLLYDAWVLLANGAYWDHTSPEGKAEWDAGRDRWRDRWRATLPGATADVSS